MGEIINATEGGKTKGNMLLSRTRHIWEDNIKVNSKHESHIRFWVDTKPVVDAATPHNSGLEVLHEPS